MSPILSVEALTKRFEMHHLGEAIGAFAEVSFDLNPGEFLLLAGPNGAGKSSLLRTIYRSYRPQTGRIAYAARGGAIDLARAADVDIAALRRDEISMVTQFLDPRPRVSAEAMVAEPLERLGHPEPLTAARWALAEFGLRESLWAAYPATFSGGERQKVNLARALTATPRLLLLDEPTASLDKGARAALVARLAQLKSQGVAMIGVFHHPGDVETLIDRTLTLETPEGAEEIRDVVV